MRCDSHKLKKLLKAMLSLCPDVYGLVLNDDGWISIKELHRAVVCEDSFNYITPAFLMQFFLINNQQYEVNGCMVRRRDVSPVLPLLVESPPNVLYIAVSSRSYDAVKKNGLKGVAGRVVLFVTSELAISVVKRRFSSYVLLKIKTDKAMSLGCRFCLYGESIYISDHIPSNAIVFPLLSTTNKGDRMVVHRKPAASEEKSKKDDRAANEAGGFFLNVTHIDNLKPVRKRGVGDAKRDPDWKIARRNSRRGG
ncbi:MAG: hypothetical protein ABWK15_07835 [Dissulfuribacterales bacterium]